MTSVAADASAATSPLSFRLTSVCGTRSRRKDVAMPKKFPPEFTRDVVTVARRGDLTVPEVTADVDVSEESGSRRVKKADVADGIVGGQTSTKQSELVQLRRKMRRLEMENEILRRAASYFAQGSLPK